MKGCCLIQIGIDMSGKWLQLYKLRYLLTPRSAVRVLCVTTFWTCVREFSPL